MPSQEEYRRKAAELCSRANQQINLELKVEYENLAFAYMRLAELAERDALLDPSLRIDPQ